MNQLVPTAVVVARVAHSCAMRRALRLPPYSDARRDAVAAADAAYLAALDSRPEFAAQVGRAPSLTDL